MIVADLEWGTVPAGFAAVGTVGALGIALFLLLRDQRDRYLEQARVVTAWVTTAVGPMRDVPPQRIVLRNGGTEPVFDLSIAWFDHIAHEQTGEPEPLMEYAIVPPQHQFDTELEVPIRMGVVPVLILEFTDARGRHWTREGATLHRIRRRAYGGPAQSPMPTEYRHDRVRWRRRK